MSSLSPRLISALLSHSALFNDEDLAAPESDFDEDEDDEFDLDRADDDEDDEDDDDDNSEMEGDEFDVQGTTLDELDDLEMTAAEYVLVYIC